MGHCPRCDFDLVGLSEGGRVTCPECGESVIPGEGRPHHPLIYFMDRWAWAGVLLTPALMLVVLLVAGPDWALTGGYAIAAASFSARYVSGLWPVSPWVAFILGVPAGLICAWMWVMFCIMGGAGALASLGLSAEF